MSVLIDNLRRFSEIDQVQIWMNTGEGQEEDEKWLRELPSVWDKCVLREFPLPDRLRPIQLNTGEFYAYTQEPGTLYFRFDDDIVFIDDHYFENMVRFRLDHPDFFLIFGNIWNNATLSYIHQQAGNIDKDHGVVESPYCMDLVGWQSPGFAEHVHRILLAEIEDGTTSSLYFDRYDLNDQNAQGGTRFSISNFVFRGEDMAVHRPPVGYAGPGQDEEKWLTGEGLVRDRLVNTICGFGLVSHYSFFNQRPHLDQTDVLERYADIAKRKLSERYYQLLEGAPLPS